MLSMHLRILAAAVALSVASSALAQETNRDATFAKLGATLAAAGKNSEVNATFQASDTAKYTYIATMEGFESSDSLEIVINVSSDDTIHFRIFPHYDGGYINLDSAKDSDGLMRTMLLFTDRNFLFWGVDESSDAFAGYTITLESGYPAEAIETALRSMRNTDQFVGKLRPFIDGTAAPAEKKN
jgi:hypothetical protein